jgi:hypothetical protein
VAKIENANSVRPFGDYSIHVIKYFTQVIKRAAIAQLFHHSQPAQKLSSNFRMPFGPFLDPASSHDPHRAQNVILFLFVQANLENDNAGLLLGNRFQSVPCKCVHSPNSRIECFLFIMQSLGN